MPARLPNDVEDRVTQVEESYGEIRRLLTRMDAYPEVQQFGQGLLESVLNFGECELLVELGDKEQSLEKLEGASARRKTDAQEINEHGQERLRAARKALKEGTGKGVKVDEADKRALRAAGQRFRRSLVKSPLKAKDARQIADLWDEASAIDSLDELSGYLARQAEALEQRRGSASRGTEQNIPIWKIAAAAAIVGIAVWGVICCNNRSCWCPDWMMALANIALAIAATAIWFC